MIKGFYVAKVQYFFNLANNLASFFHIISKTSKHSPKMYHAIERMCDTESRGS